MCATNLEPEPGTSSSPSRRDFLFKFGLALNVIGAALVGIPVIGYIPQPNYLLAGPADGCIEKLSPELLHSQIQVFAKLLHAIDTMTAAQLKGA